MPNLHPTGLKFKKKELSQKLPDQVNFFEQKKRKKWKSKQLSSVQMHQKMIITNYPTASSEVRKKQPNLRQTVITSRVNELAQLQIKKKIGNLKHEC